MSGKLKAVVGLLTVLKNFLCCRSTAGLRKFLKFCRSSDVEPTGTLLRSTSILLQKQPRAFAVENSSCSACGRSSKDTSHLILHCPATNSLPRSFFATLSLYDLWSRPVGLLGFWGSMVFRHAPSLGKGRLINNNNNSFRS